MSSIHKERNQPCFIYTIKYDYTTFTSRVNVHNENTAGTEGIQITLNFIMSSISLVKFCCFYENKVCINRKVNVKQKHIIWMRSDFKVWIRLWYFRGFCRRTATLYFWHWFCSFQLELARPSYINRKIETFERFLVMQKFETPKIVFVKVESSVTRNIWKRSLIQKIF